MDNKEVLESMKALHELCNALLGKLEAVQVTQDALMGALVRSLPPLLEPVQNNIRMLAASRAQFVEPGALESFRNNIATIQKGITVMGQKPHDS